MSPASKCGPPWAMFQAYPLLGVTPCVVCSPARGTSSLRARFPVVCARGTSALGCDPPWAVLGTHLPPLPELDPRGSLGVAASTHRPNQASHSM